MIALVGFAVGMADTASAQPRKERIERPLGFAPSVPNIIVDVDENGTPIITNGGKRPGASRPKGSRHRIKTSEAHISVLARPWTSRAIYECCLLAFGTTDPEQPGDRKLIAQDPWLRFNIMRFLMERAWGRAPLEVEFENTRNVNVRYSPEELAKLTLEQISALWREQVSPATRLIEQQRTSGTELEFCRKDIFHWWS